MSRRRSGRSLAWLAALLALSLALWAAPAFAHDTIARTEQRQVGPYQLEIGLDRDPPRTGQELAVTVRALPSGAPLAWSDGGRVTVIARPADGTDATDSRPVQLRPEAHDPTSYAGVIHVPVQGAWTLEARVTGPLGEGVTTVPLAVAGPAPIPVWLGWLIGLSPLVGLAWFARWNRTYLRRLRAEAPTPA